jgi:cytochrome P450
MPYILATYPNILGKVREEVESKLIKNKSIEEVSLDDVSACTYTAAVVKELLRCYGAVPCISFEQENTNTGDITLSNGLKVGPNDIAWINIDGIHMNEKVFENAHSFHPARWLTTDTALLATMELNFLEFGSGPRICPGMNLAYMEMILAMAFLAYYTDIAIDCDKREIQRVCIWVAASNKMPIRVSSRKM